MLNKLKAFMGAYRGQKIVCCVSGGADSMALLWGLYLLKGTLEIDLSAAHFNHRLRAEESQRDENFVREFCSGYGIALAVGSRQVVAGPKGLEAAAREARYQFLKSLPGVLATAHTADDNAETVLMHLVRGTGLKGLGGIAPVSDNLIRPMLNITRAEVLAFLEEYHIPHIEDSTNAGDDFLRNRLRHWVMPLLQRENPGVAEGISATAQRLRQDEMTLKALAEEHHTTHVPKLRALPVAIRNRILHRLLVDAGVKEPEAEHITMLEKLVFSPKPSARAKFPGNVTMTRCYNTLMALQADGAWETQALPCPGLWEGAKVRVLCSQNQSQERTVNSFALTPKGKLVVRSRQEGDSIRLSGGTKSLKKLFIDSKIPAAQRQMIPVLADEEGVVGVVGFGGNLDRISDDGAVRIQIENL